MALNPNYEAIGKAFTTQYYALFDDVAQRQQLSALYNVSDENFSINYPILTHFKLVFSTLHFKITFLGR